MNKIFVGRGFLLFLCLIFAIVFITGCQDNNSEKVDDSFLKNSTGNVQNKTVAFYFPIFPSGDSAKEVFEEISLRARKAFGINLVFKESPRPTNGAFSLSAAPFERGIDAIDAAIIDIDFRELLAKDYIMDISEIFKEHAPMLYNKLGNEHLQQVSLNGRVYAIPPYMSGSKRMCAVVRKDIAQKYNIRDIQTLEDYENLLALIKNDDPDNNLVSQMNLYDTDKFLYVYGYGTVGGNLVYRYDDPEMKLIPWEQTEEYKDFYARMRALIKNRLSLRLSIDPSQTYENVVSFLAPWDSAWQLARAYSYSRTNYQVFPMYRNMPAERTEQSKPCIVINKKSANPELVAKIVEWIHSDEEIYNLLRYGIEGKHFTVENGRIKLSKEAAPYYGWIGARAFIDEDYEKMFVNDPENLEEVMESELNIYTRNSPSEGFVSELDTRAMDIFTKRNLEMAVYIPGEETIKRDINEGQETVFDFIIKREKQRNVDYLLNQMQQQLDKWRKGMAVD